ncbi:MAG: hypothetical protein QM784_03165 [Polyangiaceae bacterium]
MSASENLRVAPTLPSSTNLIPTAVVNPVPSTESTSSPEPPPQQTQAAAANPVATQASVPSKDPSKDPGKAPSPKPFVLSPPESASVLKELRRQRAKKLLQRILFLVVLPTILSAIYFGFFATNEYESECVFVIERRSTDAPGLEGPTQTGSSSRHDSASTRDLGKDSGGNVAREEALLAKDFILSSEMVDVLDRRLRILAHYRDGRIDWLSRLPASSSREQSHDYYLKRLSVNHDPAASTLTVRFRAFEGPLARRALETILETTEQRLNALGARALEDRLNLAERELARAKAQLDEFEPATLAPQPPPPPRSRDAAAQGETDKDPRHKARLMLLEERAEHLVRAEERVQHLKDELKGQSRYVARVAGPSVPDEARYPRRGRAVLTTFLLSIVGMGILSLLFSAIREHTNL